ncbi:MAG: cytochrome d ubiquinol oxidase subunit II [Anaerolineae bacterium]|nr:cytochrome d ubiquinol oxidase subunit II [Anaerolineae bacterium]MDW8101607.1 cytochrome d ubiquinol oxidase subunit II [Anaerolineae bacterium]
MSHEFLQNIWYLLIGVLLTGYAVLDGFDLGVGVMYPFVAKKDEERRLLLNSIGPFWDGNEVWLLTGGGALFAAFPHVYATVFSGFYLALFIVLSALILRAVSFEFRSKEENPTWRKAWDYIFFVGSLVPAVLTGVAVGNIMRGVPLNAQMEFIGNFFTLLNPFSLLVGLTGLAMFVSHGAIYLMMKTNGPVAERARRWANGAWIALVVLAILTTIVAAIEVPQRFENASRQPLIWAIPVLTAIFMGLTRWNLARGRAGLAFLFSSLTIVGLMAIFGAANYPYLVPASNVPEYSLTIFNASSSRLTLLVMLIIALIGMPIVIIYTAYIYYALRGKARVEKEGY